MNTPLPPGLFWGLIKAPCKFCHTGTSKRNSRAVPSPISTHNMCLSYPPPFTFSSFLTSFCKEPELALGSVPLNGSLFGQDSAAQTADAFENRPRHRDKTGGSCSAGALRSGRAFRKRRLLWYRSICQLKFLTLKTPLSGPGAEF